MKTDFWLCALVGVAGATAIAKRQDDGYEADPVDYQPHDDSYAAQPPPPPPYTPAAKPTVYQAYPAPAPEETYVPYKPATPSKPVYQPYHTPDAEQGYPAPPPPPAKPTTAGYPTKPYPAPYYQPSPVGYPASDAPQKYAVAASEKGYPTVPYSSSSSTQWRPKTSHPEFFSVRVDEKCDAGEDPATTCKFDNYAIRLEQGIVIATPYNKWWDPKLPIFFVDDDTELYTVSKQPLQLYVDSVTGALRYAPVGYLPPNSIAFSFYKTGNNPLGNVDPSPAHLSWPSTQGNTLFGDGPWDLCALGNTGQYQVFVSNENYESDLASGVYKDATECSKRSLAAINATPWGNGVTL